MTTYATRTRPFTSPHHIDQVQAAARDHRNQYEAQRKAKIKELIAEAPADNKEEFYWTMVYDLDLAPDSTTRALLLEQGIIPVPPQELITDADMHDELWAVIEAMSKSGTFLLNTDHLTDRDLYARLYYKILDEPVRIMPPSTEAAEYIDCLHTMDQHFPLAQKFMDRIESDPRSDYGYTRGPICNTIGALSSRDNYLPRPTWT